MKLILENWNNFLNEQAEGGGIELYHATCAPPEAFAKGIDVSKAKGFGQGEGFYLFTEKDRAIGHAENLVSASVYKQVRQDCSKGAYIVIVDEPVTPENYDIDYEPYGYVFIGFVVKKIKEGKISPEEIGLGYKPEEETIADGRLSFTDHDGRFGEPGRLIKPGDKITKPAKITLPGGMSFDNFELHRELDNPTVAEKVSKSASMLAEKNPELFKEFEQVYLSKVVVLKYNGKKKIFPLRIEDLEGKTVWSRK